MTEVTAITLSTDQMLSAVVYATLGQRIDSAMVAMNQACLMVTVEAAKIDDIANDEQKLSITNGIKLVLAGLNEAYLNALDALCTAAIESEISMERVERDYGTCLLDASEVYAEGLSEGRYPNIIKAIEYVRAHREGGEVA